MNKREKIDLGLKIVYGIMIMILFIGGILIESYHYCYIALMFMICNILLDIRNKIK